VGINCGDDDTVLVTRICGQDINTEGGYQRRLTSSNDVFFSLIMNAVETDLRQTDTLIGQYMQGSSLTTILTAILDDIASSTTTQTLGSVTGITYTFVNSVIDTVIKGLGLYYPNWGKSEACINDGNQPGEC
jgi:hypothetical protein